MQLTHFKTVSFFTWLPSTESKSFWSYKHWWWCGWFHLLSCISLHWNLQTFLFFFFFGTNKLPIHLDYTDVLKFGFVLLCLFWRWTGPRQLSSVTITSPLLFWEEVLEKHKALCKDGHIHPHNISRWMHREHY